MILTPSIRFKTNSFSILLIFMLFNGMALSDDSWKTRFDQAQKIAHSGQYELAITAFDNLLKSFPDDPDILLARGRTKAWAQQFESAETDLQKVVKDHPEYADAWSALADLYRWWLRPADSAQAARQWVTLEPQNPNARIALAKAHIADRKFPEARIDLSKAHGLGADPSIINPLLLSLDRVPSATPWESRLWYQNETVSGRPDSDGHRVRLHLQRRLPQGSVALGIKYLDRFNNQDQGGFIDIYHDLWKRAYGNLRFEIANDPLVMPQTDTFAGIYQGVSTRWEIMGSVRHLVYDGDPTDIYTLGIGFFPGSWYLRLQGYTVPQDEGNGGGIIVAARRYLGDVDNYADVSVVKFKEFQSLEVGPVGTGNEGVSLHLHFQKWLGKRWGLGGGYSYSNTDGDAPDTHLIRAGVFFRW